MIRFQRITASFKFPCLRRPNSVFVDNTTSAGHTTVSPKTSSQNALCPRTYSDIVRATRQSVSI